MKKPGRIYKCSICGSTEHNKHRHFEKTSKVCVDCNQELSIENFIVIASTDSGEPKYFSSVCKECDAERNYRRYRKSIHEHLMKIFSGVKQRVHKRGMAFDIDIEWLEYLYEQQGGLCFYSGLPMSSESGGTGVSIDRRNASGGYTKDNVVLTCWLVNNVKRNLNEENFLDLCEIIATRFS